MVWYLTAVLSSTGKIGVINSVCTSLAVGFIVFKEVPSRMEITGVVAIVIGVVMTQLPLGIFSPFLFFFQSLV